MASVGNSLCAKFWTMQPDGLTLHYITRWDGLPVVRACSVPAYVRNQFVR